MSKIYGKHVPQLRQLSNPPTSSLFFLPHHLCQSDHYYKVYLNFLVEIFHLSQINFNQAFVCLNHNFKMYPSFEDTPPLYKPFLDMQDYHFNKHA